MSVHSQIRPRFCEFTDIIKSRVRPRVVAYQQPEPGDEGLSAARFIARHPVFRYEHFVAAMKTGGRRPRAATLASTLRYHVAQGHLQQVRRGLYLASDRWEPLLVASKVSSDAVLAYDSALEVHGLGSVDSESHSVLTRKRTERLSLDGMLFEPIFAPRALGEAWRTHVVEAQVAGHRAYVTSVERTYVDACDQIVRALRAPTPTFVTAFLEGFMLQARIDYRRIVDYALQLQSKQAAARLGLLLQLRGRAYASDDLKRLEVLRPASPVYFLPQHRATRDNRLDARWNVVIDHAVFTEAREFGLRGAR